MFFRRDKHGKEYTIERLAACVKKEADSAAGYSERIFEDVRKFTTGADLELDFFNKRTSSNSRAFVPYPAYESEAQVSITQPLLRGAGLAVNIADFRIAKNNKLKSVQDFKTEVIRVLTNVKKSYYDFQYSREQYIVAQKSLSRVEDLHSINKEKYVKGLASDIDIIQSEAEVARIRQALYEAESIMKLAEDNLKLNRLRVGIAHQCQKGGHGAESMAHGVGDRSGRMEGRPPGLPWVTWGIRQSWSSALHSRNLGGLLLCDLPGPP